MSLTHTSAITNDVLNMINNTTNRQLLVMSRRNLIGLVQEIAPRILAQDDQMGNALLGALETSQEELDQDGLVAVAITTTFVPREPPPEPDGTRTQLQTQVSFSHTILAMMEYSTPLAPSMLAQVEWNEVLVLDAPPTLTDAGIAIVSLEALAQVQAQVQAQVGTSTSLAVDALVQAEMVTSTSLAPDALARGNQRPAKRTRSNNKRSLPNWASRGALKRNKGPRVQPTDVG